MGQCFPHLAFPPDLAPCKAGCRGFIGPVPPPLLIRGYSVDAFIIARPRPLSRDKGAEAVKIFGRYPLGLGLKMRATTTPRKMAAVIPPAAEVTPPVRAPNRPFSATASLTPLASR